MPQVGQFVRIATKIATTVGFFERRYNDEKNPLLGSTSQGVGTVNTVINDIESRKLLAIFMDVTNVGAGPGTVALKVQVQDPVSTNWVTVKTNATVNAVNTFVTFLGPVNWPADASPVFFATMVPLPNQRTRIATTVAVNAVTYSLSSVEVEWG